MLSTITGYGLKILINFINIFDLFTFCRHQEKINYLS